MLYYPIGKQEFEVIRTQGFTYVDKTFWAHRLGTRSGQYFLSRPRRFGKSLLVSTLKELFSGDRALFKGLWIEPHLEEIEQRRVFHLSFNTLSYKQLGLEKAILQELRMIAKQQGIPLESEGVPSIFNEIILKMAVEKPIAVLIDEYDKPIIDYLDDFEKADANREILKSFYSILKNAEKHIHLLFITGVSKFSKVSIFSDLNHLVDISMEDEFSTITGFTQEEVEKVFGERITEIGVAKDMNAAEIRQKVRLYYDGYSWDGMRFVYNPFSLLSFLSSQAFNNFWFETGTPTFLVKHLKINRPPDEVEGTIVQKGSFNKFDLSNVDVIAVMFQTGYLTVKRAEGDGMSAYLTLGYPNEEVRFSFEFMLLEAYARQTANSISPQLYRLRHSLLTHDAPAFVTHLKAFFSSVPFDASPPPGKQVPELWEGFFHALTYLLLKVLDLDVRAEVASAQGRTDVLLTLKNGHWVIEFKMGSAKSAMTQIKKQGYADPFRTSGKPIILLGLGLSSDIRNVKTSAWERIEPQ